ncbi:MAG: hypothetical protein ACLRMZ_09240 [Blautia marasmi]
MGRELRGRELRVKRTVREENCGEDNSEGREPRGKKTVRGYGMRRVRGKQRSAKMDGKILVVGAAILDARQGRQMRVFFRPAQVRRMLLP